MLMRATRAARIVLLATGPNWIARELRLAIGHRLLGAALEQKRMKSPSISVPNQWFDTVCYPLVANAGFKGVLKARLVLRFSSRMLTFAFAERSKR